MNKRLIIGSGLLIIILIAAAISIYYEEDNLKIEEALHGSVDVDNANTERKWLKKAIGNENQLNSVLRDSIYRGVGMKRFGDSLYVVDFGDMAIKRFTLDGEYVDRFGRGKGRGPGEFMLIPDFTVFKNQFLFALDARKRVIMKFDNQSSKYLSAELIEYDGTRITASGNELVLQSLMQQDMFKILNADADSLHEFGTIIENQLQNALSLAGNIRAISEAGDFIYVPRKASYIFYFSNEGDTEKVVRTVDGIPFQKSTRSNANDTRLLHPPQSAIQTEDIDIHEDKIYLSQLSTQEDSPLPESFLDVYDLETGNYLHSAELPVMTNDIVVTNSRIYLLTRDTERVHAYVYNHPR